MTDTPTLFDYIAAARRAKDGDAAALDRFRAMVPEQVKRPVGAKAKRAVDNKRLL
jgi:hypothetical protein